MLVAEKAFDSCWT